MSREIVEKYLKELDPEISEIIKELNKTKLKADRFILGFIIKFLRTKFFL